MAHDTGADRHLSVAQAARELGVSPATIRRACDAGVLLCHRSPGGHRRIAATALLAITRDDLLGGGRSRHARLEEGARVVAELAELAETARDLHELAREVAGRLLTDTGAVDCDIFMRVDQGGASPFRCVVSLETGGEDDSVRGYALRPEVYDSARRLVESRAPVLVADRDDPGLTASDREALERFGFGCELGVPLLAQDRLIGLLYLYGARPHALDGVVDHVGAVAAAAAPLLEKALLVYELERRNRVLAELLDLAGMLSQTYDVEALLRTVGTRLLWAVDASNCDIYRREGADYRRVVSAARDGFLTGVEDELLDLSRYPATAAALRDLRPMVVTDLEDSELTAHEQEGLAGQGLESELCIPLVAGGESIGLIDLFDVRPRDWQDCAEFAAGVGQLVAGGLANALLFSGLERRNREADLLNEIARNTAASLDLGEIAEAAIEGLRGLVDIDTGSLTLLEGGGWVTVYGSEEPGRPRAAAVRGDPGTATMERISRERVLVSDSVPGTGELSGHHAVHGNVSSVAIGLFDGADALVGLLMLGSRSPGAFSGVDPNVLERVGVHLSLAAHNARLYEEIKDLHLSNLKGLSTALNAKDYYTLGHAARVAAYIVLLGEELGWDPDSIERVRDAAYLHDIGKIGVSDRVLLKQGPLNPEEWELMREHPSVSAEIIRPLFPPDLVAAVRHHHERLDGTGYPDGLAGELIPELARALCVVDSYDAMSLQRPYRGALTAGECLAELDRCSGHQFDPAMVAALKNVLGRLAELRLVAVRAAQAAVASIDPVLHAELQRVCDVESDAYAQVQSALRAVRDDYPQVRFMTTEMRSGKRCVIVVDAEETGTSDFSPPGEEVMADDAAQQVLSGRAVTNNVLFVDNFGVWVNGIAPLTDADGRIIAAAVADVPALGPTGAYGFARMTSETPVSTLQEAAVRLSRAEIEAITDGLTGLYNHRHLHESLSEHVSRAMADGAPLSVLFCDLDLFKDYNDRYGHAAGDAALRATARVIESCTRRADLAARYGGEEFVVLLPGASRAEALAIAGRIRAALADRYAQDGGLTISIGVATLPGDAGDKEALLEAADRAMYEAKRQGRDRVIAAGVV